MSLLRTSINSLIVLKTLNRFQIAQPNRSIKRWVAPTLRELRKRATKLGAQEPQPRSGFIEWNYRSELFAFGKRLNEEFQLPILQTAFTERSYILKEQKKQRDLGIDEADLQMSDNAKLAENGKNITKEYVTAYLEYSLPKVPSEGRRVFSEHLLSETTLAHIATNLGMKELIFSAYYPPSDESLAQALFAVIGALEESTSTGNERAFLFVRDFICTQLNQVDLMELWTINNPEEMLKSVCKERKMPEPEPRLVGDCGKNTVLSAYQVGIYSNKKLIGKGFGEDIPTAIKTASLDSLQVLFGIGDNMRPFNFEIQVEPKNVKLGQS